MRQRANLIVAIGIGMFAIGAVVVVLLLRSGGGDTNNGPVGENGQPLTRQVLVATVDIDAGKTGDEVLQSQSFKLKTVPITQALPDAIENQSLLSGKIFVNKVLKDTQIGSGNLRVARLATIDLPKGKEAVAIKIPFVNGVAGYVGVGDLVNVFTVIKYSGGVTVDPQEIGGGLVDKITVPGITKNLDGDTFITPPLAGKMEYNGGLNVDLPLTRLLLSNVKVLDVSAQFADTLAAATPPTTTPGAPATPGSAVRAAGDNLVMLLAVTTSEAERLIFAQSFTAMYLSLVNKDNPATSSQGVTFNNFLG